MDTPRPKEIAFRDELPDELRQPIIDILRRSASIELLREAVDLRFNRYGIDTMPDRDTAMSVSKEESDYPDFVAIKRVLVSCEWFRLYDLLQDIFQKLHFHDTDLREDDEEFQAYPFQDELNAYFVHAGIGWQMVKGKLTMRGDAAFERTAQIAPMELRAGGRTTAAECIEDAIRDLSFWPKPRLGAAVGRATNAMECVLHDITGEKKMAFGQYLKSNPNLIPGDIAKTLGGLWGYASNEGARHGKEGVEPPREEAEFIVAIAAALTTYLNRKHPR